MCNLKGDLLVNFYKRTLNGIVLVLNLQQILDMERRYLCSCQPGKTYSVSEMYNHLKANGFTGQHFPLEVQSPNNTISKDEQYYFACLHCRCQALMDSKQTALHSTLFANKRDFTHNQFLLYTIPSQKIEDIREASIKSRVRVERTILFTRSNGADQILVANIAEQPINVPVIDTQQQEFIKFERTIPIMTGEQMQAIVSGQYMQRQPILLSDTPKNP